MEPPVAVVRRASTEPTLVAELRSSALLFGLAITVTAGTVGATQFALKLLA
ncbi:MAG: hypothetical protein LC640_00295 [Frankia sp.]|nr:hypothetical protein [Frankia sp.]